VTTETTRAAAKRLLDDMRRAYDLVQERRPDEALALYRTVLGEARRLRLCSAHLHWAFAAAADYAGELEMAFEQATLAIEKDPLAPLFRHSFDVITGRINAALADPARAQGDPSTPRLYALLLRADAAKVRTHLAMVRFQLASGLSAQGRVLLDAVTLLHPASREA
jgi:hypothetical protein